MELRLTLGFAAVAGFDEPLGALESGQSIPKSVRCAGESGLKISFSQASTAYTHDDLSYIEDCRGYRVAVTLTPDPSTAVSQDLAYESAAQQSAAAVGRPSGLPAGPLGPRPPGRRLTRRGPPVDTRWHTGGHS